VSDFLAALGLMLVFEGLLYLAFADRVREWLAALAGFKVSTIRAVALTCAALGLALLWLVRG
jgi:uncharacterized protein YjeT (DUF2065 family)